MLNLLPAHVDRIAAVGAHCDDIAIGAGGLLLELCRRRPGLTVDALVLCGGGTAREQEERAALASFCPDAKLDLTVLDMPDGRVPPQWERAKTALADLRAACDADLVLAPAPHDAHQDHHTLAKLVPTVFRNHLVLSYEILKWDGDLAQPNTYVPMSAAVLQEKVALLHEHYGSQHQRTWFDPETFAGLARIRGVQCQERYAEAFHVPKLVVSVAT